MWSKKFISIITLGSAVVSFAGATEPSNQAIAFSKKNTWDIGVQALYINPSYSAAFTQINTAIIPGPGPFGGNFGPIRLTSNSITHNNSNFWEWGFKLEGAYHFINGNDLNLNWYHYSQSEYSYLQQGSSISNFIQDELTSAALFSDATNYLNTKWDAVNLELGQHLDFTTRSNVRLHAGFQYADIRTINNNTSASNSTAEALLEYTNITNSNTTMNYSGFGPRIGIDLFYNINPSFLVYGKAATALLVGSTTFNQYVAGSYTPTATTIFNFSGPINITSSGSRTAVVPELEAKAGITYAPPITKNHVALDAGWMWANYFNAQSASASPHGIGSRGIPLQTQLNFQIQGAYIGLKWLN